MYSNFNEFGIQHAIMKTVLSVKLGIPDSTNFSNGAPLQRTRQMPLSVTYIWEE